MHLATPAFFVALSFTLTTALNVTFPTANSTVDTTKKTIILWTYSSRDPVLINIDLSSVDVTGEVQTLATNVSSSAGKYTVPANTIHGTGSGWALDINSNGKEGDMFVTQSKNFTLESGAAGNGGASASASATSSATAAATPSSGAGRTGDNGGVVGAVVAAAGLLALL